jgi:hypothetical protein
MRQFYSTGKKFHHSSVCTICLIFRLYLLLILNTLGSYGSPYTYQKANTTSVAHRAVMTNLLQTTQEESVKKTENE